MGQEVKLTLAGPMEAAGKAIPTLAKERRPLLMREALQDIARMSQMSQGVKLASVEPARASLLLTVVLLLRPMS